MEMSSWLLKLLHKQLWTSALKIISALLLLIWEERIGKTCHCRNRTYSSNYFKRWPLSASGELSQELTWIHICNGTGPFEIAVVIVFSICLVVRIHGVCRMCPNRVGLKACAALLDRTTVQAQPTHIVHVSLKGFRIGSCLRQAPPLLRCCFWRHLTYRLWSRVGAWD